MTFGWGRVVAVGLLPRVQGRLWPPGDRRIAPLTGLVSRSDHS